VGTTPSLGQHNFTRVLADRAAQTLEARTGERWSPEQVQAAAWTGIKSREEGTRAEDAAFNFADALRKNYAQTSWESAPGMTTGHFPEFANAPLADRQAYHNAIRDALTDENGRDTILSHLGMLTGKTIDAPGVFEGRINPGSQSQVAVGNAPGGWKAGIDAASRSLLDTAEMVRGLLLRQDAVAWHKPAYSPAIRPADVNLVDVRMGRPLSADEAQAVTAAMKEATGSEFYAPIGTEKGFRFLNVPEASGLDNKTFAEAVRRVAGSDILPGEVQLHHAKADSFYHENNWQENPGGEDYLRGLSGTGRPHLERAAAELLGTLGPRVAKVEEDFARTHGWTPNRESRVWENPLIAQHRQDVIPNPTLPWQRRLIPVDHDPFAPMAMGGAQ
jgi:hypothetical protein